MSAIADFSIRIPPFCPGEWRTKDQFGEFMFSVIRVVEAQETDGFRLVEFLLNPVAYREDEVFDLVFMFSKAEDRKQRTTETKLSKLAPKILLLGILDIIALRFPGSVHPQYSFDQ